MKVDIQYAESHFADIVAAASRGEEVEIEMGERKALLLVSKPVPDAHFPRVVGRKHLLGAWEGLVRVPTDEEWRAMDREIEDEMLSGPLFPVEPA